MPKLILAVCLSFHAWVLLFLSLVGLKTSLLSYGDSNRKDVAEKQIFMAWQTTGNWSFGVCVGDWCEFVLSIHPTTVDIQLQLGRLSCLLQPSLLLFHKSLFRPSRHWFMHFPASAMEGRAITHNPAALFTFFQLLLLVVAIRRTTELIWLAFLVTVCSYLHSLGIRHKFLRRGSCQLQCLMNV